MTSSVHLPLDGTALDEEVERSVPGDLPETAEVAGEAKVVDRAGIEPAAS